MVRSSSLTADRLSALYVGEGFGGNNTMRAKVIRELIDEIRTLRAELASTGTSDYVGCPQGTRHLPRHEASQPRGRSEAELGGGVVIPGLGDSHVLTEGGQGAMTGLVGDGPVRGPTEMGVGDEAGP